MQKFYNKGENYQCMEYKEQIRTISSYLAYSLMFLLVYEYIRLFFSAVFFINLVRTEINPVSFIFLIAFVMPAILLFIKTETKLGFLVVGSITFIARFVLIFPLAPMLKIIVSATGLGAVLIWILSAILGNQLKTRTILGQSFLIAILVDLSFRALGNSIDISILPAVGASLSIIGFAAVITQFALFKTEEGDQQTEKSKEGTATEKKGVAYNTYKLAILLIGSIFIYTIVLLSPNALLRWATDLVSITNYWIVITLELVIVGLMLVFYHPILDYMSKLKRYNRLLLFLFLEIVIIPMLLINNVVLSYFAVLAVPTSLIFLLPELNSNFIPSKHRKKLVIAFTISTFGMMLLFLINIFAFNYAYVPAGDIFRGLNNWVILIPLIIAAFFVMEEQSEMNINFDSKVSRIIRYAVPIIAILLLIPSAIVYASINPATTSPNELKVITYNIQQGYSDDGSFNYKGVYEVLRDSGADIIGLQETETSRVTSAQMSIVQWLASKLDMYSYEGPALNDLCYGIGLLSRYPIISVDLQLMPSRGEQTAFISAMIDVGGSTINVIVTHFGEYYDDRLAQAIAIYDYVEKLTVSSSILIGDFNTEYGEQPYNVTIAKYKDAWMELYPTGEDENGFSGNTSGTHRIDMIFYYGFLTCIDIQVLTDAVASDHKPVIATFSLT